MTSSSTTTAPTSTASVEATMASNINTTTTEMSMTMDQPLQEQQNDNDGNNNEANDSNNNVGLLALTINNTSSTTATPTPLVAASTPTTTDTSATSVTTTSAAEAASSMTTLMVPRPPALPPRPPNLVLPHAGAVPRQPQLPYTIMQQGLNGVTGHHPSYQMEPPIHNNLRNQSRRSMTASSIWKSLRKKYVLLCCLCGGLCVALGILYLVIYFVLGKYTSSMHYFQTMPLYIPSIVLCVTGLLVLCFVRRGNRNGYLIKLCGICCLASAVLCVVITVTTTVIHMNRLQTLRECVYQGSIQTCTCFAGFFDPTMTHHDATMRFVFAGTPNCEVVHGVLYSCLRALFGLSVIGILVCIFSCMLVYQLLSHERKKKYWEQLELRCRHLYRRPPPFGGHHHPHLSSASAAIMLTNGGTPGSQCGYCTEDPRYYNMHLPEMCPGSAASLWGGPVTSNGAPASAAAAAATVEVTASSSADSCYWNPPRNGNFYSPNPEVVAASTSPPHANQQLSGIDAIEAMDEEESSSRPALSRSLTRSLSRSFRFRNWFPWLSSRIAMGASGTASELNAGAVTNSTSITSTTDVQMRSHHPSRPPVNPMWRHSNPDSHYGFRVGPPIPQQSSGGYHRGGRGGYHLPSSGTTPADLSHYAAIPSDHLPRYLWGPPPPYSQPPSIENIREATASEEAAVPNLSRVLEGATTTNQSQSVATSTTSPTLQSTSPISGTARTTRSGLLNQPHHINHTYDETVKSAMHLYERTINSNSLPSRRIRKNMKSHFKSNMAKSVANLQRSLVEEEEAALFCEVRQKLNALNGMYRYQHSKAAQELAEIRRALNSLQTSGPGIGGNGVSGLSPTTYKHQNLPLPPIPKQATKDHIYQPPSIVSNNSCSTENKYETIGKSLEPFKIQDHDQVVDRHHHSTKANKGNKPKRLPSTGSSYSTGSTGSSSAGSGSGQAGDYGFSSSVSPMSVATTPGCQNGSQSPSSSSDHDIGGRSSGGSPRKMTSSHYAQISPLRGQGLPPASAMGLRNSDQRSLMAHSPAKSYFEELQRQDAAKSLPNINAAVVPMASTSPACSKSPSGQINGGGQHNPPYPMRSPINNNNPMVQSPASPASASAALLLQPQNLHQLMASRPSNDLADHMMITSTATTTSSMTKPRSYSASSEMLLNNFHHTQLTDTMQLLQQHPQQPPMKFNQNTRALVGSPIHQYHKYSSRPLQRPRAASSSSMLNQESTGLHQQQHQLNHSNVQVRGGFFHPYQHLPGASLSLQMLNSHKISTPGSSSISGSGSCVYLRPEQNIPEVFANPGNSVFKPIDEVDGNNSDVNDNNDLAGNSNRSETTGAISRDDIVVTMRSVNV